MSVNTLSATVNLSEQEKHCIESLRVALIAERITPGSRTAKVFEKAFLSGYGAALATPPKMPKSIQVCIQHNVSILDLAKGEKR